MFEGRWWNAPPRFSREVDALHVETGKETDLWNNTFYGFRHLNGHVFGIEAAGDQTLTVSFLADYRNQYDQAGAAIRVDDTAWLKCGIEFTEGSMKFSVVVTRDDQSDWSVRPYAGDPAVPVRLRLTRHAEALRIDVWEGEAWQLARVAFLPMPEVVTWGLMACSPSGEGLAVTFSDVALGPAIEREMV